MFRSALLKLTFWYLLIIMGISVFFSMVLYQQAHREIEASLSRQALYFQRGAPSNFDFSTLDDGRVLNTNLLDQIIANSERALKLRLLYLNLLLLGAGGAMSYFLALRTLEPIQEMMEEQSRFTADASHELRTPLTAMQTEVEVALRDKELSLAGAKNILRSNLEEIETLRKLSAELLRLARQEKGRQLQPEPVDLLELATQAAENISPLAAAAKVTVEVEGRSVVADGNRDALKELLIILLDNAVKYNHPSGSVDVTVKSAKATAVITVRDTGAGISAADLPHIFTRFYRTSESRSKQEKPGYGLGLAIAKKIVDQHHGTIHVASRVDKGSIFTIELPLKAASARPFSFLSA